MKTRTHINLLVVALALLWSATGPALAGSPPQEPGEEYLISEDVNGLTGLYTREYSLARNGIVDYRTARQILRSDFDKHRNPIVRTKEFPLFYWYDSDHDGQFEMWIDRNVQGCTCDIVPYSARPY